MATIGNLFVTVGANVAPLEKGMRKGRVAVEGFAASMTKVSIGAAGIIASVLPGAAGQAASRIMSGMQGVQNMMGSIGKLAAQLGPMLANPFVLAAAAAVIAVVSIAAVGAAIYGMTVKAAKLADTLKETTDELGTNAESFQKLEYIGTAAGASAEKIKGSITKMSMAIAEAGKGGKEANEKFQKLGVNLEELGNMDPSQAFQLLIQKIGELPSHTEKVKALRDLFGRGGTGLAGMVALSTEEFEKLSKEADKFSVSNDSVQKLASLQDSMDTFGLALERIMTEAFAPFAPLIEIVYESMKEWLSLNADKFIDGMKEIANWVVEIVDRLAPIYRILMIVWDVFVALESVIYASLITPVMLVVKGLVLMIETMNMIPGLEIPTAGLQKTIDGMDRMQQKLLAQAFESGADVGTQFNKGLEQTELTLKGTGKFQQQVESQNKKKHGSLDMNTEKGFKIVDPKAVSNAEELKKKLEDMSKAVDDIHKTEEQLLEAQLRKLGAMDEEVAKALNLQKLLKEGQETKSNQAEVTKQLEGLEQAQINLTSTEDELLIAQMTRLNATKEEIAKALELTAVYKTLTETKQNQKQIDATLESLRDKFNEMTLEGANVLERTLQKLGATAEQIAEATTLQTKIDDLQKSQDNAKELVKTLDDIAKKQKDMGKSEIQLLQERLVLLGATATQIEAATKAMQAMDVANILNELAEAARTAGMNEKELLADKLRNAGANEEEIERGLKLQSEIEKKGNKSGSGSEKEKGNIDALDTALGSMKIAGLTGMIEIADAQLSEAVEQTEYLRELSIQKEASPKENASVMTKTAQYQGGQESTDQSMSRQIELLAEIAYNTKAFLGVMS